MNELRQITAIGLAAMFFQIVYKLVFTKYYVWGFSELAGFV